MMKQIVLEIAYIGTGYHGWQVQKNAVTVQQKMNEALYCFLGEETGIRGCSRTDSGVHANSYVCSFFTDKNTDIAKIPLALNMYLPDDIAVKRAAAAADDFHPRYSCISKQYIYKIYNSRIRDPFSKGLSYRYVPHIDEKLLDTQAKDLLGTHDFKSFCCEKSDIQDTVRTLTKADVTRDGDNILFTFEADGFLYNMVRIMTGTLLFINSGRFAPGCIPEIILAGKRQEAGFTVPGCGLYLNKVNYGGDIFGN